MGKGKSRVGKMDAILLVGDSLLDTRIEICILVSVTAPKLEYAGEARGGNANFVKQLEAVRMTAVKHMLGFSRTASNTVLRAELGMFPAQGT